MFTALKGHSFYNMAISNLEVILLLHSVSTQIAQRFGKRSQKIGFQDGAYGGHFGFPICMILAIFHPHVNLLLHYKFQLNSPCGLRDVQNRFSIWWLWQPSWISDRYDFSSFRSRSCPIALEQVLAQIDQRFAKRCRKLSFKMAAVAAILNFLLSAHQF